jgi:hypothetical protein
MRYLLLLLPILAPAAQGAKLSDRWVAAFYAALWDAKTGEGMTRKDGGDALQDHPTSFKDFSYARESWHRRNLEEMAEAGIDVALCEFANRPRAVDALLLALQDAAKDRKRVPKVAPAVTDFATAVAFLGRIPAQFQSTVDRRPLVWMLPTAGRPAAEQIDPMRLLAPMFIVGEPAWKPDLEVVAGGAHDGPAEMEAVTLGPGFSDGSKRFRARNDGAWYERSWYAAMRIKPRVVAIESWNRFHEGSTICPTEEHGKALIAKTKKYAEAFRRGEEIPRPKGKYSTAAGVSFHLKFNPPGEGLDPLIMQEAPFEVVELAGQRLLAAKPAARDQRILAFVIDDSYAYYERREYEIQLQILDKGKGEVVLEYDAAVDGGGQKDRTRRPAGSFHYTDSGDWTTATFRLPEAAFANRQEGGGDFRLVTQGRGLSIRWVQVRAR